VRDIELQQRLERLLAKKLPPAAAASKARELTARLRDEIVPLATQATAIARNPGRARLSGLGCACVMRADGRLGELGAEPAAGQSAIGTAVTGAKIGTAVIPIPVVGTAIGAVGGALAGFLLANKHYINVNGDNAEEDQDVLDIWPQYRRIAGQVAGRDIGLPLLERIWRGAVYSQSDFPLNNQRICFHAGCLKYPGNPDWIHWHIYTYNAPHAFPPLVQKSPAMDPRAFIDTVFLPGQRGHAPEWARPNTPAGKQVLIDIADAYMAQKGAPYYYGQPQVSAALPQAIAPPAPTQAPAAANIVAQPLPAPLPNTPMVLPAEPIRLVGTNPSTSSCQLAYSLAAQGGVSLNSAEAQNLLQNVCDTGIQRTPGGPPFLTAGLARVPGSVVAIAGGLLVLSLALARPARSAAGR